MTNIMLTAQHRAQYLKTVPTEIDTQHLRCPFYEYRYFKMQGLHIRKPFCWTANVGRKSSWYLFPWKVLPRYSNVLYDAFRIVKRAMASKKWHKKGFPGLKKNQKRAFLTFRGFVQRLKRLQLVAVKTVSNANKSSLLFLLRKNGIMLVSVIMNYNTTLHGVVSDVLISSIRSLSQIPSRLRALLEIIPVTRSDKYFYSRKGKHNDHMHGDCLQYKTNKCWSDRSTNFLSFYKFLVVTCIQNL